MARAGSFGDSGGRSAVAWAEVCVGMCFRLSLSLSTIIDATQV